MNIFETSDPVTLQFIENIARLAREQGQRLRLSVDTGERDGVANSWLKVARGGSMWTIPLWTDSDSTTAANIRNQQLIRQRMATEKRGATLGQVMGTEHMAWCPVTLRPYDGLKCACNDTPRTVDSA